MIFLRHLNWDNIRKWKMNIYDKKKLEKTKDSLW